MPPQRLMELAAGGLTGAAYGEKDAERLSQRNGYRDRDNGEIKRRTQVVGIFPDEKRA